MRLELLTLVSEVFHANHGLVNDTSLSSSTNLRCLDHAVFLNRQHGAIISLNYKQHLSRYVNNKTKSKRACGMYNGGNKDLGYRSQKLK